MHNVLQFSGFFSETNKNILRKSIIVKTNNVLPTWCLSSKIERPQKLKFPKCGASAPPPLALILSYIVYFLVFDFLIIFNNLQNFLLPFRHQHCWPKTEHVKKNAFLTEASQLKPYPPTPFLLLADIATMQYYFTRRNISVLF